MVAHASATHATNSEVILIIVLIARTVEVCFEAHNHLRTSIPLVQKLLLSKLKDQPDEQIDPWHSYVK